MRRHMLRNLPVRHCSRADRIKRADPLRPGVAGRFLNGSIADAGESSVIARGCFLPDDVQAGGGVRLARFPHPGAVDELATAQSSRLWSEAAP